MKSELLLDPRLEILDIIDEESSKYQHTEQYVRFDDNENVIGCCINGLVMLHFGWKPDKLEMTCPGPLPENWQNMALLMRKRYGENVIGDINTVNAGHPTWSECKEQLKEYWNLP